MWLKPDPMGERNPFQVYMLCLAILSGASILISDVPASAGSIEQYLVGWQEAVWGWLLVLGSSISLLGMYWQRDARDSLLMRRFGFLVLSVPLMVYSIALVARFGFTALTLSMTIMGFAAASLVQAFRVNKVINEIIHQTEGGEAEGNGDS